MANQQRIDAQRKHFARRAKERVGLILDEANIDSVVEQIQEGESEFVRRQSNRVTHHRVVLEGTCTVTGRPKEAAIIAVYDSATKTPRTVLHEGGGIQAIIDSVTSERISDNGHKEVL